MYRYLAIFRDSSVLEGNNLIDSIINEITKEFKGGKIIKNAGQFILMHWPDPKTGIRVHNLSDDMGSVIGHLFYPKPDGLKVQETKVSPLEIEKNESHVIVKTSGEHLIENYWGNYIAFLFSKLNGKLNVVRSPFSTLPCYCFAKPGFSLIFSDFEFVRILKRHGCEMDWDFAPIFLKYSYIIDTKTSFKNLMYINSGQRLEVSPEGKKVDYVWNPENFMLDNVLLEPNEAMNCLRNVTLSCIDAWSSLFSSAILDLSGGFDSSLVAGLFGKIGVNTKLTCITRYDRSPLTDERMYARKTVEKWGHELLEIEIDPGSMDFSRYFIKTYSSHPLIINNYWRTYEKEMIYADKKGAEVKFTGNGGDVLFEIADNNNAARDYVFDNGVNLRFLKIAMNSAVLSNWTLVRSIFDAICHRGSKIKNKNYAELNKKSAEWGIHPNIKEIVRSYKWDAPWLRDSRLSMDRKIKISLAMFPSLRFNIFPHIPYLHHIDPLLSQPIVEICFRIPSYIHVFDGRERGLARRTFREFLVDEVRLRQFKTHGGAPDVERVRLHRRFHIDYLLGGVLAEKKIIDTNLVEKVLLNPHLATPEDYARITAMTNVEAWARSWV